MPDTADKAISEFVEQMGLIIQSEGLPRIAGHIVGLMIMHEGPFSLTQLAERLSVSRASISTNTRLLEDLGVIVRHAKPGDRQDYFRLGQQPYARILRGVVRRMRRARDVIESTRDALPEGMADAQERLQELDAFYEALTESFLNVIDAWDAETQGSTKQKRDGVRPSP
ncbi:GbsR/MarR family transcriptional regulator [Methyloceanibacter methanicus]|uniref:GbsR/MarR family transcriptional regulator n=1 Tax=Methyloceanibacter methanicus TaxID=1774968 RepID=UPI0008498F1E|nr:MarR family transcriptional regulator [Methyloceanibacter methanicus]